MRKDAKNKKIQIDFDIETLKMWKNSSTKARIEWLNSAFRFGKLKKF